MAKEITLLMARQLLESDRVTPATRKALLSRLEKPAVQKPAFFDDAQFELLQLICDVLIPQSEFEEKVDLAGPIDERLARRETNGWRYDTLPDDGEAYRLFLAGVDQAAYAQFGQSFTRISHEQQATLLQSVQQGEISGPIRAQLPGNRFFEELLAEVVEIYYSHPLVQLRIGYTGMADLPANNLP